MDYRVLIVDDSPLFRATARRAALQAGVAAGMVREAGNGREALEQLRHEVADLVLLETDALGPDSALCAIGSLQAAAVANAAGIPVWLVAGIGRCLPQRMWEPLRDMVISDEPWEDLFEVVPTELMTSVIGPGGPIPAAEARFRTDCPVAPELFR